MWSRRKFLAALSATGASSVLPNLACRPPAARLPKSRQEPLGDERLLDALSTLDTKLDGARVWSCQQRTHDLSHDHEEEQYDQHDSHRIVLSGQQGKQIFRVALLNPTTEELLGAAVQISKRQVTKISSQLATPNSYGANAVYEQSDYRTPLRRIFHDAQEHGSSRIIYRFAYLQSTHSRTRYVSRSQDLSIESHRSRGGLVMGTWTGNALATGEARVSGQGGPGLVSLTTAQLEAAGQDTLSHLHARGAPSGDQEVLLCSEAAALLGYNCIAHPRAILPTTHRGMAHVVDDPRSGYGGLTHDDEGAVSRPQVLLGPGTGAPLRAEGRMRFDGQAQIRQAPTHVRVAKGQYDQADLVSRIKNGVLLQGPELCWLDSRGERVSLLSSSCREIREGRFTGRVFSHTLSTFLLSEFLSNTVLFGNESSVLSSDKEGIAGSAEAPSWLSRARVETA